MAAEVVCSGMDRRTTLRTMAAAGIASLVPLNRGIANPTNDGPTAAGVSCVLIPQETEGPYPVDLSGDPTKFRQDITEGGEGIPLIVTLTVVNANNSCAPIPNARVDIWHCDKDGYYSGFANQMGYLGTRDTRGQTFMRGIQMTDADGRVTFSTIYPGWYPGRVTHIHFQVFLNSMLRATSQMAFPDELNDTVYGLPPYTAHGRNTNTRNSNDGIFSDSQNTQYQIADIVEGDATIRASLLVPINAPVTGVATLEPETGGQFTLGQNYPNPASQRTTVPFTLVTASHVRLALYDCHGRLQRVVLDGQLDAGPHTVAIDGLQALGAGGYVYQLDVANTNGRFHQARMITVR